ncbi:hypothetical protein AMJ57_03555 [Parcubacteria bacterium SG8_24]|nr:MAG: hypothetical protein AMJ57_03555 [Parcubacteria bacterium SG8_24]
MPLYGDKTPVASFEHRDMQVDIYETLKGATHCGLEHEPTKKACEACGEPIMPQTVYLIYLMGQDMGMESSSEDDAIEQAMAFIDDYTDEEEGAGPEIDETDDVFECDECGSDEDDAPGFPTGRPRQSLDSIKRIIRKLGWANKALTIIREADADDPD